MMNSDRPTQKYGLVDKVSRLALFKVAKILFTVAGFAVLVLLGVSIVSVFGRISPLAGAWLAGAFEVTMLTMAIITVLSGAYVWYLKGHVRVGLIRDMKRFGRRSKAIWDAIASATFLFWVVGMSIGGVRMARVTLSVNDATVTSRIPLSPFHIIFVALLIHFAFVLLRSTGLFLNRAAGRDLERDTYY